MKVFFFGGRWYRGDDFEDEVTAGVDSRYTLTNGKLIIQNPVERLDANQYRCTAQNHLGVVMSNDVRISFGGRVCLSGLLHSPIKQTARTENFKYEIGAFSA